MNPQKLAKLAAAAINATIARDAAIVEAAKDGMTQPDICAATKLSPAQVRRIERAGGIPPRTPGRRPGPSGTN